MASWVLTHSPWSLSRARLRLEFLAWSTSHGAWSPLMAKTYFSTPHLSEETPAMMELKKLPYPSTPLDPSLFEEMSEEYVHAGEGIRSTAPDNPSQLLIGLVRQKKFSDADRVYGELKEMGVSIKPNAVYQFAAIESLYTDYASPQDRASAFVKWVSLIPRKDMLDVIPIIMRTFLTHHTILDLPLLAQFALIVASKGFANVVARQIIPHLVRYTSPAVFASFLDAFRISAWTFIESSNPGGDSSFWFPIHLTSWYGYAIRGHCLAGRPVEAFNILQSARSLDIGITHFTYDFLTASLRKVQDEEKISVVESLRRVQAGSSFKSREARKASPAPANAALDHLVATANKPAPPNLAFVARLLKAVFSVSLPIPSGALASLMRHYASAGRFTALRRLRDKAYKTRSRQVISTWALGEMLYHLRRGEKNLVIAIFAEHFQVVGVPLRVFKYISRTERRLLRDVLPPGFLHVVLPRYRIEQRMWPSTHHTALIWRAAILFTESRESLEKLYQQLLTQVASTREPSNSATLSDLPATAEPDDTDYFEFHGYPAPAPPPILFDSAHFNAFVHAFAHRLGPPRAAQVIIDMYRLGISPSTETLNILAGAFARAGNMTKLNQLLDRMDGGDHDVNQDDQRLEEPNPPVETVPSRQHASALPRADVVTYTAVIRWLFERKYYEDAAQMAQRLKTKTGYIFGTNPITDQVLQELACYVPAVEDFMRPHI
ncbi:hypothetical protein A0H81_12392 [Grifola frondosa]|uniref:Pentatricopeptide repeat-containing protein n=1 Tax=Grifola frondosa TaxID=5627 RepID=A0A1C7LU48_GRIFR|nr:hypothetical protein A0H81_12392 [Grifola frondosa]